MPPGRGLAGLLGPGGAARACRVRCPLAYAPLSPERPGRARRTTARLRGAAGLGAAGKAWAVLEGALPARRLFIPVAVTLGPSAAALKLLLAVRGASSRVGSRPAAAEGRGRRGRSMAAFGRRALAAWCGAERLVARLGMVGGALFPARPEKL